MVARKVGRSVSGELSASTVGRAKRVESIRAVLSRGSREQKMPFVDKEERASYQRDYRAAHRAERNIKKNEEPQKSATRERSRNAARRYRLEAIEAYGGACVCCGETTPQFLTLDHPDGGGKEYRRENKNGKLALWAKKNGYPSSLRLLCWNCNCGRELNGGICPHQQSPAM